MFLTYFVLKNVQTNSIDSSGHQKSKEIPIL